MTVNKFYSFSIRPNGIQMDFSRKDKLIENLLDYCLDVQYIAVHMNEREAYQKAELKLEVEGENIKPVREILKIRGLEKQIQD